MTRVDGSQVTTETARQVRPARPAHLRLRYLVLVALGGTVGTALRELLTLLTPSIGGLPLATFFINVVGAFVLGLLLEILARRGPDAGRRRVVRILVGTGVLGGFTTYSALAATTAQFGTRADWFWAVAYPLGTVLLGAAASMAGIALGSRLSRVDAEATA